MVANRRIIQIAGNAWGEENEEILIALCDDGTLWRAYFSNSAEEWRWNSLPNVPQSGKKGAK